MDYGICHLTATAVRAEPSERSEMVSQLLFGEMFEVTDEAAGWVKVLTHTDDYEGWINHRQFLHLTKDTFNTLKDADNFLTFELVQPITVLCDYTTFPLVLGSSLPGLKEHQVVLENRRYQFDGRVKSFHDNDQDPERITSYALMYLNCPYLWGGRTPFGIDCSGLTQMAYRLGGIILKRDASQQALQGETLSFITEARPGDLAFFDDDNGDIIHTGIILKDSKIIHASGKVRIDRLDHQGIYNKHLKKYTHRLRLIKRIIAV